MKDRIKQLKLRYMEAKSDKERDALTRELHELCDMDEGAVAEAALEVAQDVRMRAEDMLLREQLSEILPIISISHLAKTYFQKTPQWFYQRLNGNVVNGKVAQFTPSEMDVLKHAFLDISTRINAQVSVVF